MLFHANDASTVGLNATLGLTRVILPLPRGLGRTLSLSRSRMDPGAESSQGQSIIPIILPSRSTDPIAMPHNVVLAHLE
jgi:hypothetical protein